MENQQELQEFVDKVRAEYPDKKPQEDLEKEWRFLGRHLDDTRNFKMSAREIVKAFEDGREEDVKQAAEKAVRCTELYFEWVKIEDRRCNSQPIA